MDSIQGSCLCEGVRFELTLPSKWVAHCHCSLCRRAHGAAFVTWMGVKADCFRLTSGAESLAHYRSTPEAKRSFCKNCGSPLFFESSRWPDEVHIAVAHLQGAPDRMPQAHVWFDNKVSWVEVHDNLPKLGTTS